MAERGAAPDEALHEVAALVETPSVAALVAADPAASAALLAAHRRLALGFAHGDEAAAAAHVALWRLLRLDGPVRPGTAEDAGSHVLVAGALDELARGFLTALRRAVVPPVPPVRPAARGPWFAEEVLTDAAARLGGIVRLRRAAGPRARAAFDRHARAVDALVVDRYADLVRRAADDRRPLACALLAEAAGHEAATGTARMPEPLEDARACAVRSHGALLGRWAAPAALVGHLVVVEVAAQRLAAAAAPPTGGTRAASATRRLALLDGLVAPLLGERETAEQLVRGALEALHLVETGATALLRGSADDGLRRRP